MNLSSLRHALAAAFFGTLATGVAGLIAPRSVFGAEPAPRPVPATPVAVPPAPVSTAGPVAPPTEAQIEAWIAGLADEDQATRKNARQSLIDAGALIVPRLQKELEKNDLDFESRLTLKLIIEAIPKSDLEYSLVHGTAVTLDLKDGTLGDALHSVESQCDVSFADLLLRHSNCQLKKSIKFHGTFWEALHQIAVAYEVSAATVAPDSPAEPVGPEGPEAEALREFALRKMAASTLDGDIDDENPASARVRPTIFEFGQEPIALAGPCCLRLVEMSFKKNMRTGEQSIVVTIEQYFEPMVDSAEFGLSADSIVINGKPAKEATVSRVPDMETGEGFIFGNNVTIPYPKEGVKTLSIGGTIRACVSDRKGRKEINLKKDVGKSFALGAADFLVTNGPIELESVLAKRPQDPPADIPQPPSPGDTLVGLILTHDAKQQNPLFLEGFENNLQFLSDAGKPMTGHRYSNGDGEVDFNGRAIAYHGVSFWVSKDCAKIVLQYPMVVKHVSIPFQFENVPLPERGN